ncbi:hypothetical protein ABGB09_34655 [Streptomyces sp. B8F3]
MSEQRVQGHMGADGQPGAWRPATADSVRADAAPPAGRCGNRHGCRPALS